MTCYSPWKAAHHPERLAALRSGEVCPPSNVQIDLEGWCPYSCQFCSYRNVGWQSRGMRFQAPSRVGPTSGLPREIALALPAQLAALGVQAVEVTGGGEPLASPYGVEFFDRCLGAGLRLALITNGLFFGERVRDRVRGAAWVRLSVDAATPETYARIHRTDPDNLQRVLDNLSAFVAVREPGCKVGVSFVVAPDNVAEVYRAALLYRDLGVDNVRFAVSYEPTGTGGLDSRGHEVAARLLAEAGCLSGEGFRVFGTTYRLPYYARPNDDFSRCHVQRFVWAIGTDARVYPCCIEKYHEGFALGDLRTESVETIARRQVGAAFDVTRCKPCWLRDKNLFVDYLLAEHPEHVEFV